MFIVVMLLLFSILAGISYYLARKLYLGLASFLPHIPFWPVLALVCTLTLFLLLGFARTSLPLPKDAKHILGLVSSYCMGIFLYLFLFTVAADLAVLVCKLAKAPFIAHRFFKGFVTIGVLLLTGITCIGGFVNGGQIDHISYEIRLRGKQDISDMKVVLISDLHLGAIGSEGQLEKIVDEINALQPDLVCIAGDVFDTDFSAIQDPDAALKTLQALRPTYGTYACLGNHDGGQTHNQMTAFLKAANIQLLDDAYAVIDDRLVLVGRMDASPIGGYGDKNRKALSEFFTGVDPSLPVIVLDHNPANIHEYNAQVDLILCGHTHKGQVFPGSLITNLLYTVDYGYYQKDAQSPQVIVTSGVGTWGMPMRVGTDCEIVTIRFTCD